MTVVYLRLWDNMSRPPSKRRKTAGSSKAGQSRKMESGRVAELPVNMVEAMQSCITAAIPDIAKAVLNSISQENPANATASTSSLPPPVANASTVQDSVAEPAFQDLTGTSSCEYEEALPSKRNLCKPIDVGLDPKIKSIIVADEYIDIGLLLNPSKSTTKEKFTTEIKEGSLSLVKLQQSKTIDTSAHWLSCFSVFGAIYSKRHPQLGHSLFQYARRIQDIAEESGDAAAISYDKSFRLWREQEPADCPWEQLNVALYHEALAAGLNSKLRGKQNQPFRSSSGQRRPFQNKKKSLLP